jgi:cytochrome c556
MPITKLATLSLAVIATLSVGAVFAQDVTVDPKIAGMSNDELVAARQEAMKEDGKALKAAFSGATGQDAIAAAQTLLQNFTDFPALFKEGATNDKSKALPIIWTEFDKFSAIFAGDAAQAKLMLAAAQGGDMAGYTAAAKAIGGSCGECHQTYRQKNN